MQTELERLQMAWAQAVWDKDYRSARKIAEEIQRCLTEEYELVQELWPGARILDVAPEGRPV